MNRALPLLCALVVVLVLLPRGRDRTRVFWSRPNRPPVIVKPDLQPEQELIDGLRAMADWFEGRTVYSNTVGATVNLFVEADEFEKLAKGRPVEEDERWRCVTINFGDRAKVTINCERVKDAQAKRGGADGPR